MKQEITTFKIYFDGGTDGINPSAGIGSNNGYGSWEVCWNGFSKKARRIPFLAGRIGQNVTNNVAEYLALIGALQFLQSVKHKGFYRLEIYGDSQLVLKTLTGEFKARKPHLKPLRATCHELTKGFAGFKAIWNGRAHNVARFGH